MKQSITITGMTCGSCVAKIQKRLVEHAEIESAAVTLQPPRAVITGSRVISDEEINFWLQPLGRYQVFSSQASMPEKSVTTYRPLIILFIYLILVTTSFLIATGQWDTMLAMRLFMGGFFIAFSFFKMLDLRGFADAYQSYDIIAKAWPSYGRIYPFIELSLGLAYIANLNPLLVNLITAITMGVSLIGVVKSVFSKQIIRCACLGTVFQLPMSTVTIIEDGLMLIMAIFMLLIY
ncbi:MAG: heavy-metal-associated domain-containing protein [Akkermansiaceae bacterium]|nr:heavy-metal-associated domain-containing protein [Akkermansiaceae bacterium]